MKTGWLNSQKDRALSVMRIVVGFTFMAHGIQKVFGLLGGTRIVEFSLVGAAGYIELIGGILIMTGLLTRPVAFILSGQMAVAYFGFHAPAGLWPVQNRGELAVVYCFVFLYLVFSGGGAWSLDALRRGRPGR